MTREFFGRRQNQEGFAESSRESGCGYRDRDWLYE